MTLRELCVQTDSVIELASTVDGQWGAVLCGVYLNEDEAEVEASGRLVEDALVNLCTRLSGKEVFYGTGTGGKDLSMKLVRVVVK